MRDEMVVFQIARFYNCASYSIAGSFLVRSEGVRGTCSRLLLCTRLADIGHGMESCLKVLSNLLMSMIARASLIHLALKWVRYK